MAGIDMDLVVNRTIRGLGADNALLQLELNATRAALDAAQAELEQLKATKEGDD